MDSAVQNNTQNAQDFFETLVNIVGPVRQAIRLKCQSMGANFKFDNASQIESVPMELRTGAYSHFAIKGSGLSRNIDKKSISKYNLEQ